MGEKYGLYPYTLKSVVLCRAVDKREYLVIIWDTFVNFAFKHIYIVTPHLNRLDETVQMRGHNIWFQHDIRKLILHLSSNISSYLGL